jgi:crossover junction endodeoxyribonuclease RuvC
LKPNSIILGIDPGTIVMGYGIIEIINNNPKLLSMGVLQLGKYKDIYQRLHLIHQKITEIHKAYQTQIMAIEAPFYGKNVQSMLKLGRAQGVAIATAMSCNMQVQEYMPKKVKQSVTGNGNASKEQVAALCQQILKFKESPTYLDASDAVAVALCHYYQSNSLLAGLGKSKGWDDFIKNNPDRVKVKTNN